MRQAGNTPRGAALWTCVCECGTTRTVVGLDLRHGKSASCGCSADKQMLGNLARTHGATGTRLHYCWQNMLRRCRKPTNNKFRYYGARGILVCSEWDDFDTFRTWALAHGYNDTLTLERIDVNGNYCPSNCRWATLAEQAQNKTNSRKAPDGELWLHKARRRGIKDGAFRRRLFDGWPPQEAASVPMNVRRMASPRDAAGRFS